ncbi:MAG TPA: hypothetical protein VI540_08410 [Gaiellaceae bacterium]|nr:hypothetical protein [Gaiellaceae bacterium]
MKGKRLWEIGGFVAGAVLIAFGVVAIYMGVDGRTTVRDSLKQEQIYFGSLEDPAVAEYASEWGAKEGEERGAQVQTGEQARQFAQVMRYHTVNAEWNPEHLTYSQMGRFLAADDPGNPAGTSDDTLALKDEKGNPVSNNFRNQWVTETALTTALNMSFMAEQLSVFGLVVGLALLLTGIGLVIIAFAVFGRLETVTEARPARTPTAPVPS